MLNFIYKFIVKFTHLEFLLVILLSIINRQAFRLQSYKEKFNFIYNFILKIVTV